VSTIYPSGIDNNTSLPQTIDLVTPVKAEVVNNNRGAILAIEAELGINPSREFATVRARLDRFQSIIESGAAGGLRSVEQDGVSVVAPVSVINFIGDIVTVSDAGSCKCNVTLDTSPFLLLDGTRAMTGALDMGTNQINNVVDPVVAQDAATKAYVDAQITANDSWSESLAVGNTTDGYNPIISTGDSIFGEDDLNLIAGNGVAFGGDVNVTSGAGVGGAAGDISITGEDGSTTGGNIYAYAGSTAGSVSGSRVQIRGGPNTTLNGAGGPVYITGGSVTGTAITAGDVIISGGSGPGPGHSGGDVNITGGGGSSGATPGQVYIYTTAGADAAAGPILISSGGTGVAPTGSSSTGDLDLVTATARWPGNVNIQPGAPGYGAAFPGTAGTLNLLGADSSSGGATPGGDINIISGDGGTGTYGGSVTIDTGTGDGYDGYIVIQRGGVEVARWDNNNNFDLAANRGVDFADPIDAQDAATKNYVDGYFSANNEWSEILANGNTSGGTNPEISAGDQIQGENGSDLTLYASGGGGIISNVAGTPRLSITTTEITVGASAFVFETSLTPLITQNSNSIGAGSLMTIRAQAALATSNAAGGNLQLFAGNGGTTNGAGGNLLLTGGRPRGSGEPGSVDVLLFHGTGSSDYDTMASFDLNTTPIPDRVQLSIGNAAQGYDGEIVAPDGSTAVGHDLFIAAGGGDTGLSGGDLVLSSGAGNAADDGYVIIQRGTTEVARWDNGGSERLLLQTEVIEIDNSGSPTYIQTSSDNYNALYIRTGDTTGNSGFLYIRTGATTGSNYTGAVTIQSGDGAQTGNVEVGTGDASNGSVGYLTLKGGDNTSGSGGTVNIDSGTGTYGGYLNFTAGNATAGNAPNVTISAGRAVNTGDGGNVVITGGQGFDNGGDVILDGGQGDNGDDGYIIIKRNSVEIARWDVNNNLDLAANRGVDFADPIDLQDAVTKNYVDSTIASDGYVTQILGTVTSTDDSGDIITIYTPDTNDTVYFIEGVVVARDQTDGSSAGWKISGVFERTSGTVAQVGSASIQTEDREDITWTVDMSTDGTDVTVDVVGDAANSVNWKFVGLVVEGP